MNLPVEGVPRFQGTVSRRLFLGSPPIWLYLVGAAKARPLKMSRQVASYRRRLSFRDSGPKPYRALKINTSTLNRPCKQSGNQHRWKKPGVIWTPDWLQSTFYPQCSIPTLASRQSSTAAPHRAHCNNLIQLLAGYAPQWQGPSSPGRATAGSPAKTARLRELQPHPEQDS